MTRSPTFQKVGLEHFPLDGDVDRVMERLARDWSERDLEGVGGTGTSEYRGMPQSKDKRRRMARDRALARRDFGLDRLTPKGNELVNFGDRPVLAYDEQSADAADSFAAFFPDAARIKTNAI